MFAMDREKLKLWKPILDGLSRDGRVLVFSGKYEKVTDENRGEVCPIFAMGFRDGYGNEFAVMKGEVFITCEVELVRHNMTAAEPWFYRPIPEGFDPKGYGGYLNPWSPQSLG